MAKKVTKKRLWTTSLPETYAWFFIQLRRALLEHFAHLCVFPNVSQLKPALTHRLRSPHWFPEIQQYPAAPSPSTLKNDTCLLKALIEFSFFKCLSPQSDRLHNVVSPFLSASATFHNLWEMMGASTLPCGLWIQPKECAHEFTVLYDPTISQCAFFFLHLELF